MQLPYLHILNHYYLFVWLSIVSRHWVG